MKQNTMKQSEKEEAKRKPARSQSAAAFRDTEPQNSATALLDIQATHGNHFVQRLLTLDRKVEGETETAPEIEEAIQQSRGGGQPLESQVRNQMESAFGADFGRVRVHTDAKADTLNRALNARAFTTGQDIFFRQGEYEPGYLNGRELLAHELTHVIQQNKGLRQKLVIGSFKDEREEEADNVAKAVVENELKAAKNRTETELIGREIEEKEDDFIQTKVNDEMALSMEGDEEKLVRLEATRGTFNEDILTNHLYFRRHPDINPKIRLVPGTTEAKEWIEIRDTIVRPVLESSTKPEIIKRTAKFSEEMPTGDLSSKDDESVRLTGDFESHASEEAIGRFANILQIIEQKLLNHIARFGLSFKYLFGPSKPDKTEGATESSAENMTQAGNEKELNDVLKVAQTIEDELKGKFGKEYAKGKWVKVSDDPSGERLKKIHHTEYRKLKGREEDKNITYEIWKGGFLGYGPMLRKTLKGKVTGFEGRYVCTEFVEEVLKRAGFVITKDTSKLIQISIEETKEQNQNETNKTLNQLLQLGDERMKGVVTALVASNQGEIKDLHELKAGDLVQYWHGVEGHVVIVWQVLEKLPNGAVKIKAYGSHKSAGGVSGEFTITLKKNDPKHPTRKVYCVRPSLSDLSSIQK